MKDEFLLLFTLNREIVSFPHLTVDEIRNTIQDLSTKRVKISYVSLDDVPDDQKPVYTAADLGFGYAMVLECKGKRIFPGLGLYVDSIQDPTFWDDYDVSYDTFRSVYRRIAVRKGMLFREQISHFLDDPKCFPILSVASLTTNTNPRSITNIPGFVRFIDRFYIPFILKHNCTFRYGIKTIYINGGTITLERLGNRKTYTVTANGFSPVEDVMCFLSGCDAVGQFLHDVVFGEDSDG